MWNTATDEAREIDRNSYGILGIASVILKTYICRKEQYLIEDNISGLLFYPLVV